MCAGLLNFAPKSLSEGNKNYLAVYSSLPGLFDTVSGKIAILTQY